MRTKIVSFVVIGALSALALAGCGKGSTGSTKVLKGSATTSASALKGSLIEPKMVQSQTPVIGKNNQIQTANVTKCWSLAELTADLNSEKVANAMVVVSSYDLNLGGPVTDPSQQNLNQFQPIESNDLNNAIRANMFLQVQPTKWSVEPIFSSMTMSDLMKTTEPDLQKLASLLTITGQADCDSIRPADGVAVKLLIKTPTEIAFTDNDKVTRDYMITPTSLLVTVYTDAKNLSVGALSICDKTDNYKIKQTYLISYRDGTKQLAATPSLIQLLQSNLKGPKEFKDLKTSFEVKNTAKDLKTTADFAKSIANTPIAVTPLLLQNAINTIRAGKGFTVLTCPK